MSKKIAEPKCYGQYSGQYNDGQPWTQEWYTSKSRDASKRTRMLRKLGFACRSESMGYQTGTGYNMTLISIEAAAHELPPVEMKNRTQERNEIAAFFN